MALRVYLEEARRVRNRAVRCILLLLPYSGLRISEACKLRRQDVCRVEDHLVLQVEGKGGVIRSVPLIPAGARILQQHLQEVSGNALFLGRNQACITPHAVRVYTRRIAQAHPELEGLHPHLLRHTYATLCTASAVPLAHLQLLLGHRSIQTTTRYIHPTTQDLVGSVGQVEVPEG
jgi:integrase/recombinase XerD